LNRHFAARAILAETDEFEQAGSDVAALIVAPRARSLHDERNQFAEKAKVPHARLLALLRMHRLAFFFLFIKF
jgi:hypothetical protein